MGCYGHYELFVSDSPRRSLWRFDLQRCLSTWLVWSDPFERCGIACVVLVRRKLNASVVSYQGAMHQWRISAHRTLGARTRAQENAKAFGAHAAASRLCRQTVEHPFGTLEAWMGATPLLTKTLPRVRTEMSLHVLAYS